ncbi:MAG: HEPN domain-containing protein [Promethearchaeota archaeon]
MKPNSKKEAERWFLQAKDEFNDADELRKMKKFYLALFHFQQAAEKALKAFLYLKLEAAEVFYTHSIMNLLNMAIQVDSEFEKVKSSKKLDQYYISTRYPNGLPGGVPSRFYDDPDEAESAMILAKNLIEIVEKKLNV